MPCEHLGVPASGSSTSWAVTILGVGGGATIAFIGKSGDLYGKKRTLLVISLIFTIGTILCALTTSWPLFLVGRGLASVSFGMNVVTYSIVRDILPRRWIPICVGVLGAGIGMSGILGPLLGVIPCAIAVAVALLLRNGRKPARGGAPVTQAKMSPTAEVSPT